MKIEYKNSLKIVIYVTRTDGGDPHYINMIDRVSAYTQIEGLYEICNFVKRGKNSIRIEVATTLDRD